jgi:hypothetical protein
MPKSQIVASVVSTSVPSSNAVRASPFPAASKARCLEFDRMVDTRSPHPSILPAFRPSAKLVPPTMPSADFCVAVRSPGDNLSLVAETQHRSPEVRPTAFAARPPDLPPRPLMVVDFAITCSLVRPGRPRYPVLVHRTATLLHAFFRPHLAMTPLRFANPSPPSGWIEDFHLQAVIRTRHTNKKGPGLFPGLHRFGVVTNSPCRPCHPYHRQAWREWHSPSSAFRRPWLPW